MRGRNMNMILHLLVSLASIDLLTLVCIQREVLMGSKKRGRFRCVEADP